MLKLVSKLAVLLLVMFGTFTANAANPFTLEEYFKLPDFSSPVLSRDGKFLAATVPIKGRMNLAIYNLETGKAAGLTGYTDFDVQGVVWVGTDRLLYTLGQNNTPTGPGQFDGGGLFVIHREGSELRQLSPTLRDVRASGNYVYRSLRYFRSVPGSDEEVIASGNMTSSDSTDLYRLNIKTGRYTLISQGRPDDRTGGWILDSKLVPRVVSAGVKDKLTEIVYYRKDADSPWYEIARYDGHKGPAFVPLALEADGINLQVATNAGRDTMAVYRYDPINKKLGELIAQHPRYDMGADASGTRVAGVITDPRTDKILGYSVAAAKPERVWIDERYSALQKTFDAALPNRINGFRRTPDGKKLLVTSYSDTVPVSWYLYDEEKRRLEEIGSSRPWMRDKLVAQHPFIYKTRDGLEIDGYYFLPKDYKPGTKLPTIVHVHGGPFARADGWGSGFGVREGQLFASRGYAVIVPNHRITPGLGSKIYYGGFGTYGRQMSDDHEDALKWGIAEGFVDPAKVCISGASYGGYAGLQALTRPGDMWKCAIAGLAVTDLNYQLTSRDGDTAFDTAGVTFWKSVLGTEDLDAPIVKEISPVFHADKIKKPVFLYAGEEDIRVPIDQINRMNENLTSAGNPPKAYVVKAKEGHGYGKAENNIDLYTKILAFLKEQFGQ